MAEAVGRDEHDGLLERLQLLDEDDEAIAAFLDELDLRGPREREMLAELARRQPIAEPQDFPEAARGLSRALEALGRHGYHSAAVSGKLGPLRAPARFAIELVARYLVVSYLRRVATDVRNLLWLREIQSPPDSTERLLLQSARFDADALTIVFNRRQIGVPSFLFGGIVVSLGATLGRAGTGVATSDWRAATIVGLVGLAVALGVAWVALRGAAMASRRIRLSVREPLQQLWADVGNCGRPPRDQSRRAAIVAIVLTFGAWVIIPAIVGLALAG